MSARQIDRLPEVFVGSAAVARGLVTPSQLRDRRLVVPVLSGVYRPRTVQETHLLRCRAAVLVMPRAWLTGPSLATLRGVPLARTRDDVTLVVREGRPPRRDGVAVREVSHVVLDGGLHRGLPVTGRGRMAFDLVARTSLEEGVAHLDAVVRAGDCCTIG